MINRTLQERLCALCDEAIRREYFPGCAVAVFDGIGIQHAELFCRGTLCFHGVDMPQTSVTRDTLYDQASLTKINSFLAVLRLVGQCVIGLDTKVASIVPFRQPGDIQDMTVKDLLTCSLDFKLPKDLEETGIHLRNEKGKLLFFEVAELRGKLGSIFRYGNMSAFVAGVLLERILGCSLEEALRRLVLDDLEMNDTRFETSDERLARTAPTYKVGKNGEWQRGIVQDPMTQCFGTKRVGIAGLFSSIGDLLTLSHFLATGLGPRGPLLPHWLWREMIKDQHQGKIYPEGTHRYGLGIDKPSSDYVNDACFCENAIIMSGSSGPFIFSCPNWRRSGWFRPIGGVILCNSNRGVEGGAATLKKFRRSFVSTVLENLDD